MFADPIVAVMAMLILCFSGMIIMFVFVVRSLSRQNEEMRESFRKQQMFLTDLERQFMDMSFLLRRMQESEQAGAGKEPPSSEQPLLRQDDDLLAMLEAAAKKKQDSTLGFDDHLLPPPSVQRPLAEEYDPTTDPNLFEDSLLGGSGNTRYAAREGAGLDRKKSSAAAGRREQSSFSITLDD